MLIQDMFLHRQIKTSMLKSINKGNHMNTTQNLKPKTSWLWVHEDFTSKNKTIEVEVDYLELKILLDIQKYNDGLKFLYDFHKLPICRKSQKTFNALFSFKKQMIKMINLPLTCNIVVDNPTIPRKMFYVDFIEYANSLSFTDKLLCTVTKKKVKVLVHYTVISPKINELDICTNSFCLCEQCQPEASKKLNLILINSQPENPELNIKIKRTFTLIKGGKDI